MHLVRWASVALAVHVALFLDLPLVWQAGAAFILAGFLPGRLLVELLVGNDATAAPARGETLLYSLGAGYATIVVGMLLLNFWPGALLPVHVFLFYDILLLVLAALLWRRGWFAAAPRVMDWPPARGLWPALITLALLGALLRFPNLDYSEFQGDEARAILRAAEILRGNSAALYSHQKGPAEILIPGVIYALTERLNEAGARLPFALAGFTGLLGIYWLGRRMFGPVAGWVAAILLALDGYLIGFARIVQYQSIVFFMVVLCLLIFYRLSQNPRGAARYLSLAAILLATGLLAHYEAGLVIIPALYLLAVARFWLPPGAREAPPWRAQAGVLLRILAPPMLLGTALLAIFYVPFVLHPTFESTYGYIAESRIGGDFPYNNLADFVRRTTLYSPIYYIGLLTLAALVGLTRVYTRTWAGRWGGLAAALLWIGFGLMVWFQIRPGAASGRDLTWLFFLLAFGLAWIAPRQTPAGRAAWLWLGGSMILMLFFTRTPNTHVYGFIIPWAVIAGMVAARGLDGLRARVGKRQAHAIGLAAAIAVMLMMGIYAYTYFVDSRREVLHTWRENRLPGYWVPYAMPDRARFSSFGFPMRNGWKAIGARYAQGQAECTEPGACPGLVAPFTTNDRQAVAEWYTRGAAYCPRDHRYFMLTYPVEPGELDNVAQLRAELQADGYVRVGGVQVQGRHKLEIYDREATHDAGAEPLSVDVEDAIATFDRQLSHPWFAPNGPTALRAPHALNYRLGEHIHLEGYDLARSHDDRGAALHLTLFWRTDAPLATAYTVFNQVLRMDDFHKIGQRDGQPGCDQYPTDRWQPGVTLADRYYIPLDTSAPPGVYSLLMGLYDAATGDRLPIFAANGDFVGDALPLTEITVAE